MRPVILVPRRPDGGRRDELWAFVKRWWMERFRWDVFEGFDLDGPFNRGAAINRASELAGNWTVALIADADVIAEPAQAYDAVATAEVTGCLTRAYSQYRALSERMTVEVLDGYAGNWERGGGLRMEGGQHMSSLLAVPRCLWDMVGGFDERFAGWGHEDRAFYAACQTLGGGVHEVAGPVFHLHHEPTPERANDAPHRAANRGLADRYSHTVEPQAMRRLLDEGDLIDGALLMVITDGRRECIERTIPTLENLKGLTFTRLVICDDSGDRDYQAWLRVRYPDFELVCGTKRLGYARAMRRAWDLATASGQRFVWWHEDDFLVPQPIDIGRMADVADARPDIANVVLLRQPWFERELAAGGVLDANPDAYMETSCGADRLVEHTLGYWLNPHLVRRDVLSRFQWPMGGAYTERTMGQAMVARGLRFAFWGGRNDPPLVEHIGAERIGTGY